jgi:Ca-activated chloride channel family protein
VSFKEPLVLLSLLAVPLGLAAYWWWRRRRPPDAVPFPDLDVLATATPRPRARRFAPLALLLLALVGLGVAAARPEVTRAVPREAATIMLVVDVSGSMAADDVSPYRLRAAQDAAERFGEKVPPQFRVGLISFSGEAQVLLPPTTDRTALTNAVESLVPDGATAIGDATKLAIDSLRQAQGGAERLQAARILLLSDGANTTGVSVEEGAAIAKRAGVPVYTVALGTEDGILPGGRPVPPDPAGLKTLSDITGGKAYQSRDAESVSSVYSRLGTFIGTEQQLQEVTAWPTAIAVVLLALAGVAAWRLGPRLP